MMFEHSQLASLILGTKLTSLEVTSTRRSMISDTNISVLSAVVQCSSKSPGINWIRVFGTSYMGKMAGSGER